MRLISFVSWKGGAGKTTALMAISSALLEMGYRVRLIESDINEPLIEWRANSLARENWHDKIDLVTADDIGGFEKAINQAEAENYDFILTDTAGGGSEINMTIIANSDLVIVPTSLSVLDLDEAIKTLEFINEYVAVQIDQEIPAKLLLSRFPQSQRLKSTQAENLRSVEEMPRLNQHLTERAAFSDLKLNGLLGPYYKSMMSLKENRLQGPHIMAALSEARSVAKEIINITESVK